MQAPVERRALRLGLVGDLLDAVAKCRLDAIGAALERGECIVAVTVEIVPDVRDPAFDLGDCTIGEVFDALGKHAFRLVGEALDRQVELPAQASGSLLTGCSDRRLELLGCCLGVPGRLS